MKALKILLDERKQQLDIFEQNKEFKVFQGDEFSPPFVVKTFKTKKEADDFVDECGYFRLKRGN